MRLKKIKLKGFKSFADETVLTFDPGITAIVGPNGCGKSNIADAFRWVLGEQSAKSLRGHKMPDVIFAGTVTRKPMNYAEVTIVFNEVGDALPVDYDEVAVTRRLHRSGESEYLINKHPVRLKDLQNMFLGTGVGKNAISIFEQGKIDQVISLTPLERRGIFEEVAGISRFLMSKREALRRLEQTDHNLIRVQDIHKEVERQMHTAEKQAEKAAAYRENHQRLSTLEISVLLGRWDEILKKWNKIESERQADEGVRLQLNSRHEAWQQAVDHTKREQEETEAALKKTRELFFEARSAKEILQREKQTSHERHHEMLARKKQLTMESDDLTRKFEGISQEIDSKKGIRQEREEEVAAASQALHVILQKTEVMERELAGLREGQHKGHQERLKAMQAENQAENHLRQITMRLEHLHEECAKINVKEKSAEQQLEALEKEVVEKGSLSKKYQETYEQAKQDLGALQQKGQEAEKNLEQKKNQFTQLHRNHAQVQVRHQTLTKLRQSLEGFGVGTKKLLQATAQKGSPVEGLFIGLYELLKIPKDEQERASFLLDRYSQTLVVKKQEDLQRILAYTRAQGIHGFSLLCLDLVPEGESGLWKHLMGGVRLLDSLENLSLGSEGCSPEGYYLDPKGILFCRDMKQGGQGDVFKREAELRDLAQDLALLEGQLQAAEAEVALCQGDVHGLRQQLKEAEEALRGAERLQMQGKFALDKALADQKKSHQEKEKLVGEFQAIEQRRQQQQEQLEQVKGVYAQVQASATTSQQQTVLLDAQLEEASVAFRVHQRQQKEQEGIYQKLLEQHQKLEYDLNLLQARMQEISQRKTKLAADIDSCQALVLQMEGKRIEQKEIDEAQAKLELCEVHCREWEQAVTDKKKLLEQLDREGNDLRQRMKENDEKNYKLGIAAAQLVTAREGVEKELEEHHLLTVDGARERKIDLPHGIQAAENELKRLRKTLEGLGNVNMTAIEEYEEHCSRYKFLADQLQDLSATKQELMAIIGELDGKSRLLFEETFKAIRVNFQKNFKILFNGGEADLVFTEAEDVLEAGIEIVAKPPGKQMRSISLLSGGEKCMTAMALLFAIFEVKPAPFCILDEIDAPLDDSNVGRFVDLVKQFIDRCQFVIITHNKRTMAIADVLFGVSMEQKGVSKLLSMTFNAGCGQGTENKTLTG